MHSQKTAKRRRGGCLDWGKSPMKGSDLMVKSLVNEGVEYIFGIPGEENLDFLNSLRTSPIRFILTRHEQAAGFMAATLGRLTGKAGVCLSTLGPGATNLVTPAAYAQLGAMPLVILTGQKPIKRSKQGRFQIVDVVSMMRPLTHYTRQIVDANNIPSMVREAFRIATKERPGPVHLELPEDVAAEPGETLPFPVHSPRRPTADEQAIARTAKAIQEAKRPLILIGAGANRKRTSLVLGKMVEKTGIPFFVTQMGKGVLDERHPLYMGTAALSDGDYLHCAIDRADLIVNVGHDDIEKPPFLMKQDGHTVIHVNFFPAAVDDVYFPQLEVVGDIATSLENLVNRLKPQKGWDFDYFMRVKKEVDIHLDEGGDDDRFPVIPQRLVSIVREVMPSDGIVTLDNGIYKIWFARNYRAHQPNTLLLDNALATMGAGLPSAMTASLLYPDRKVISVCGDGGFLMNSQELETALRLELNLVVLILNDSSYGMIKWKQSATGFETFGLDFKNPDFVKYAQSYGASGHRATETRELGSLIKSCLDKGGVHVIDIPVDYSENQRVLIDELKERTCLL